MRSFASVGLTLLVLSGCAAAPAPAPRHDYRSSVPLRATPHDTTPECAQLPTAVGGFRLSSFAAVGTRCIDEGFEWRSEHDGGWCSGTPLSVGPTSWARFHRCGTRVCSMTIGHTVGGQTELQRESARLLAELIERYGEGHWRLDATRPCPRVEGDEFGCLLDGVGIIIVEWPVEDPNDSNDSCAEPSAVVALRVEGDRGTHDAVVSVTYADHEAQERRADLHL